MIVALFPANSNIFINVAPASLERATFDPVTLRRGVKAVRRA
jgi:hypothetical protein